ncbi:MAG: GNAT family N-acetyltransferase [Bacilli bacterium]|nr:GNAT family N-acetyltransferase [Bacilli bacterium]
MAKRPSYMLMHRYAVKKEHYGQGYGNALFHVFETEAKRQGYRPMRIDTHENNAVMPHLLEKNGFAFCGKAILKPTRIAWSSKRF